MTETLRLGGGALLLLAANIALGSIRALIKRQWDGKVFLRGLVKGAIVAFALAAVYLAGRLNPGLVIVETDGKTVDLATGVSLVLLSAFIYYGTAALRKLKDLISGKDASAKDQEGEAGEMSAKDGDEKREEPDEKREAQDGTEGDGKADGF